jgi:sucrose-6-phosphate hydrolase SacC (GH32 family)
VNIQDEPVLKPGPDDYDQAAVAADQIVKFRDRFYLFYHSTSRFDWQHPESHVIWTSSVAMSTDLIHWDKYPGNPIIKEDRSSPVLVFDSKVPSLYTMHPQVFRYTSD